METGGAVLVAEKALRAPIGRAWSAFTEPEPLRRWFAREANVEAERPHERGRPAAEAHLGEGALRSARRR